MIVSAQRVANAVQRQGVNTFVYADGLDVPTGGSPEVLLAKDPGPGELVHHSYELPPGGNNVLSYLDVALPGRVSRNDIIWFFNTLPRWMIGTQFPVQGTCGRGAFRFGLQLGLTPKWRHELVDLCNHAQVCLLSHMSSTPTSPVALGAELTEGEHAMLVEAATRGDTTTCLDFLRELARLARLEEIATAIAVYTNRCEVNKTPVRRFLAAQVPGILANHYFPLLGTSRYGRFIEWSVENSGWADELRLAASSSGLELRAAVDRLVATFTT